MGSDDTTTDEVDASHLTPEEHRGPATLTVALLLLAGLLLVSVITDPEKVMPRDSTVFGARHVDEQSGLDIPIPIGWRSTPRPEFGTVQIVPVGTGEALSTRILAGRLEPGIAAAAIADDRGASTALAEIVQQYVLGVSGTRDEPRVVEVRNDVGEGAATSYVVAPDPGHDKGGLVYAAVFGEGPDRSWVAYLSTSPSSSPGPGWVDRLVGNVKPAE